MKKLTIFYITILLSLSSCSILNTKINTNKEYFYYNYNILGNDKWYLKSEKSSILNVANRTEKVVDSIEYNINDIYFQVDSSSKVLIRSNDVVFYKGISIKSKDSNDLVMLFFPFSSLIYKDQIFSPLYTFEEWNLNYNNFKSANYDTGLLNMATKYLSAWNLSKVSRKGSSRFIIKKEKDRLTIKIRVLYDTKEIHYEEYTFVRSVSN